MRAAGRAARPVLSFAFHRPLPRAVAAISTDRAHDGRRTVSCPATMRRKLITLAAALSAVLCTAACVLWVRSHRVRDYAWAWLPWPADAGGQRRWLKLDAD